MSNFSAPPLSAAFLIALSAATAFAQTPKPNIVFILVDDLGWGDLGVFYQNARLASGNHAAHLTPNLDALATEGARLTHHYCAAPVCAPSRASILTGVHQGHANVRDNQFDKALEDNHTLASVLRRAGYSTTAIGKWGLGGGGERAGADTIEPNWPAHPLNRGFDSYFGYIHHIDGHEHYPKEAPYFAAKAKARGPIRVWDNRTDIADQLDKCYTTDLFTARAKKWITEHAGASPSRPFFMYLAFDTPHAVLELPTQAYPVGGGLKGGVQWLGQRSHMINTASGEVDSWTHPDYASATYEDDQNPGTPEKRWPDVYRRYATCIRRIDDCVGDLMQLLKDLHLDDNTLVVFTSDNGPSIESYLPVSITPEFFSSYGPFDGIKRDCWEGGLRVPAIVRWLGHIPGGRVVDRPSASWDWLPTFADAAGLPAPARADGVSLLPVLSGAGGQRDRGFLYFEYQQNGRTPDFRGFEPGHRNRLRNQMQAVRIGDLIGVRYDVKTARDDFEIYNVVTDAKEAHNLGADPAYVALQREWKDKVVQARRPDAGAPRPYDAEFVPAIASILPTTAGVEWRYYEGRFPWVPDLEALSPVATGTSVHPDVAVRKRDGDFGLLFTGCVAVPTDGEYTFTLRTDTGAVLRLHEATLIDADYGYASGTQRSATVKLKTGLHPFRLFYARADHRAPALELTWAGPGFAQQPVAAGVFRRAAK